MQDAAPFDVSKIDDGLEQTLNRYRDLPKNKLRASTAIPFAKADPPPTVEDLLDTREATHGDYRETAAHAQALKFVMHEAPGWKKLSAVQAESLHLIATKIARILSGDPNQKDHWDDLAGYARLVSERLK